MPPPPFFPVPMIPWESRKKYPSGMVERKGEKMPRKKVKFEAVEVGEKFRDSAGNEWEKVTPALYEWGDARFPASDWEGQKVEVER